MSTSATWKVWISIQRSGRTAQQTASAGSACWWNCWRQVRENIPEPGRGVEPSERHTDTDTPPPPPRSTSTALCAAETATPAALVLPATYDTMLFWSQHHELLGRSIHCWHRPKEALLLLLLTNTTSTTTTTTTTTFSVEPGKKHKAPSKWLCRV